MGSSRRYGRWARVVAAVGIAATGLATTTVTATASTASTASSVDHFQSLVGSVTLDADVLSGLNNGLVTSPVSPTGRMDIGVSLSRPDPAGENAYLADVYDAGSPDYHQFLTVGEFQARFGVSQARYAAAVAWLQAGGLTTTPVSGSTEYVLAEGPAAAVESLFGVQINDFVWDGATFFANTTGPTVPADLGILAVSGLQDFSKMTPLNVIEAKAIKDGRQSEEPARPAIVGPGTNTGSTTPQDLWSIYNQPTDLQDPTEDFGQGQSMAIFGEGCSEPPGSSLDDDPSANTSSCKGTDLIGNLRTDEAEFNLPKTPIIVSHYGQAGDTITDSSGTGEWELDMPASTGMAPEVAYEHLYFGDNGQDPDVLAAYDAWDSDANGPMQGSSSFAGCEASPVTGSEPGGPLSPTPGTGGLIIGNPNQAAYEALLKESTELGRTMFNSAGDLGANGCAANTTTALNGVTPSGAPLNNYPSSSDYVTTVGGTVLYWNGTCGSSTSTGACTSAQRADEYSWNYSGGGTSLYLSAPAWQQGQGFSTDLQSTPGVTYPCTTDYENPPVTYAAGTFCRGLPDVSAQSGDVLTNGYFAGGGTSLSSPLWLGMWTRIQAASSNPGRNGFASPDIYALNANVTNYENDFFDVGGATETYNPTASGSGLTMPNCSVNTYFAPEYDCSGSGWDFESGWGSPNVTNLMESLDDGNTTPIISTVTPPSATPEVPATVLLPIAAGAVVVVAARRRRRRS